MKNHFNLFSIIFFVLMTSFNVNGQSKIPAENDMPYEDLLSASLEKIKNTVDINIHYENQNELKRLAKLYPNEWLTDYYIAYMDIKLSFRVATEKGSPLLEEAESILSELLKNNSADESELYTLKGYLYYAKIAQNPAKNGQLFHQDVISNYQKAIKADNNNPRPRFLLALFKNDMSNFMGSKENTFCDDLKSVEIAFANFNVKEVNDPNWGEKELAGVMEKECNH